MERKIYGVSLGAGYETLTLKGARILKESDVILLSGSRCFNNPEEVREILENIDCGHKLDPISMPASSDKNAHAAHTALFAEKCAEYLNKGKKTAYVTMGDITVYTSFAELYEIFKKMGITLEAVTGVSAFMAPAAVIGKNIVEWNEKFCVIPMPDRIEELSQCVKLFDSTIIMKIYDEGKVLREFLELEKPATAVMVVNAYKKNEEIFDLTKSFPQSKDLGMSVVLIKK